MNQVTGENGSGTANRNSLGRSRSSCLYVLLSFLLLGILSALLSDCGKLDILIGRSGCLGSFNVGGRWSPEYLALSPDEQVSAIWYAYDGIRLWDSSGTPRAHIPLDHPDYATVGDMVFSSDGKLFSFAYIDGSENSLIILRIPTETTENREQHVFEGPSNYSVDPAIALSLDGRLVAYELDGGSVENQQNVIAIGDISTVRIIHQIDNPGDNSAVVFSPDGELLAVGSEETIQLWQVDGFQMLKEFNHNSSGILTVNFSPDGETLASLNASGEGQLWNVKDGLLIHSFSYEGDLSYGRPNLAFSLDGSRLAVSSCTASIYNVRDGSLITHIKIPVSFNPSDLGAILCPSNIAFSHDGKSFYFVANRTVRQWQTP